MIDIVILHFNREMDTRECLLSLHGMRRRDRRVILIDNGSTDGSGFRIKADFPEIDFLRSEQNMGCAGGRNLGIKCALESSDTEYILLLDNDTKADGNLLDALLGPFLEDAATGIAGAVNFYYDSPRKIQIVANWFFWPVGIAGRISNITEKIKRVSSVPGACMLIKREVIEKIGLFDERFFTYYEDSDFCLRAGRAGFKAAVAHEAKIWHKLNKTIGSKNSREHYIYTRNQPLFMCKNCPKIFLANYFILYFLKTSIRMIFLFIFGRKNISSAIFKGAADFFRGNFGEGRLFEV